VEILWNLMQLVEEALIELFPGAIIHRDALSDRAVGACLPTNS
jgi:hypothetical protein